jgi:hypothetical protein
MNSASISGKPRFSAHKRSPVSSLLGRRFPRISAPPGARISAPPHISPVVTESYIKKYPSSCLPPTCGNPLRDSTQVGGDRLRVQGIELSFADEDQNEPAEPQQLGFTDSTFQNLSAGWCSHCGSTDRLKAGCLFKNHGGNGLAYRTICSCPTGTGYCYLHERIVS